MALSIRVWSPYGSETMRVTIPTKTGVANLCVGFGVDAVPPLGNVHRYVKRVAPVSETVAAKVTFRPCTGACGE